MNHLEIIKNILDNPPLNMMNGKPVHARKYTATVEGKKISMSSTQWGMYHRALGEDFGNSVVYGRVNSKTEWDEHIACLAKKNETQLEYMQRMKMPIPVKEPKINPIDKFNSMRF